MALIVAAHNETQHEGGKHGVPLGGVCHHHESEEADKYELDLRFDHPVPVAAKEGWSEFR